MQPRIVVLKTQAEFARLASNWDDLFTRCLEPSVFLSHDWLHSWWTAYQPDAALRIVTVALDDRLIGIAPFMVRRSIRAGVTCSILCFLGDGTWETDHMTWLADVEHAVTARAAFEEALADLDWDVLQLNQVPDGAASMPRPEQLGKGRNWHLAPVSTVPCPRRSLPASYEELLGSLPSRFRTSLRSSRRKLLEAHDVEFGRYDTADQLPQALDTFFRLHEQRWQEKGQAGVFADPRKREFYRVLSDRLLARGWLYFFYLRVDGEVIAQQYCFACGPTEGATVMLLQEGFDPAWSKQNVGNTLRGLVFEYLIEQGAVVYDFLAGTSRHKTIWADSEPNDLCLEFSRGARGALWRLRGHLGAGVRKARAAVRFARNGA